MPERGAGESRRCAVRAPRGQTAQGLLGRCRDPGFRERRNVVRVIRGLEKRSDRETS